MIQCVCKGGGRHPQVDAAPPFVGMIAIFMADGLQGFYLS